MRANGNRLELAGDGALRLDVDDFQAAVDRARLEAERDAPGAELEHHLAAAACVRGPLLADFRPEEWLVGSRDRLLAQFVESAVRGGALALAAGSVDRARDLAERAIEAEPWSEPARRLLVVAHLERNDRAAARRALDACLEMLAELGVEPDPDTRMVARRLR